MWRFYWNLFHSPLWSRNNWAVILHCVDTHKPPQKKGRKSRCLLSRNLRLSQFLRTHKFSDIFASQPRFPKPDMSIPSGLKPQAVIRCQAASMLSFPLHFTWQPVSLSCIFTPCLFMRDWWQGFPRPREKDLFSLCFCWFACLFTYLFTFDLVFGDWSFITGMFYSNAVLGLCVCLCTSRGSHSLSSPFLLWPVCPFPAGATLRNLSVRKKRRRLNEQLY